MNILLMINRDEPEKVSKNPQNVRNLQGSLKNECSVFKPEILIEGNPVGCNYCYIDEYNRFYFIDEIVVVRDNIFLIKCTCDVLYTFMNGIKNLTAIIDKQENAGIDVYIDDGTYAFENKIYNEIATFPRGFNDNPDYILLTAGGTI